MLEGLALWALLVYIAVKVFKMPWNKFTQAGSVVGGACWLIFVWIGLIAWSPMDMTGGAVVQSPQVHLRPVSSDITGTVKKLHIQPNQELKKGQVVYEVDDTQLRNSLVKVINNISVHEDQLKSLVKNLEISVSNYELGKLAIKTSESQLNSKRVSLDLAKSNLDRTLGQNNKLKGSVSNSEIDSVTTSFETAKESFNSASLNLQQSERNFKKLELDIDKAKIAISQKEKEIISLVAEKDLIQWKIDNSIVRAPADGFVSNFIVREGQYMGLVPRLHMYTNEKYVMLVINHQGIRNIKPGQYAEFATPVYPGKVFKGEVQSVIEATGESTGSLMAIEQNVTQTLAQNRRNKFHYVRIELDEEDYDIPLGSSGMGWVSAEKPHSALGFLDVIRGIIIRMKSQLHYVISL